MISGLRNRAVISAFSISLCFLISLNGCGSSEQLSFDKNGSKVIVGRFDRSLFVGDTSFAWYETGYRNYRPDALAVKTISDSGRDIQILIYLGTWCSDSKREVPFFFRTWDGTRLSEKQVELIGVARKAADCQWFDEEHRISHVPTFILMRGGKEIGRIVEVPDETIEKDLAKILLKSSGTPQK